MAIRYQDYVIKNGKYVGDFEAMYRKCDDPWLQNHPDNVFDSRRIIAQAWIKKLAQSNIVRVCEIGCGFGYLTAQLTQSGVDSIGVDISKTAVERARNLHPECKFAVSSFNDFSFYRNNNINIFLMSEITWYVLPQLTDFLKELRKYKEEVSQPLYLIHLLSTYAPGIQKYGTEYFTNLQEILEFFALDYLEYGIISVNKTVDNDSRGTYFVSIV